MRIARMLVAVALVSVSPRPAESQSLSSPGNPPGAIAGQVVDAARHPVELAQVLVPALARSTVTDVEGRFVLSGVPAGRHRIRVAQMGFVTLDRDIEVVAGQRATLIIDLGENQPATVLPEIEIHGKAKKIDHETSEHVASFGGDQIFEKNRDRLIDVVGLTAGAVVVAGKLSVRGSRPDEVKEHVSGFEASNPLDLANPDVANLTVADVEVVRGGMDAEKGGALSAIIDVETREGADSLAGQLRWDTDRFGDPTKTFDRYDRVTLGVGGPTSLPNLTYYAVYEGTFTDTYLRSSVTRPSRTALDFIRLGMRQSNRMNTSAKLAWRPASRHKLTLETIVNRSVETPYEHMWARRGFVQVREDTLRTTAGSVVTVPRYGSWSAVREDSTFVPVNLPDHVPMHDDRFRQVTLSWTNQLSPSSVWTTRLASMGFASRQSVGGKQPWEYDTQGPFFWNGNLTPGTENNPYFATHGDFPRWTKSAATVQAFKSDVSTRRWTHHYAKTGLEARYTRVENLGLTLPNVESNGLPGANRSEYVNYSPEGSMFIQDRWEFEGLVLNAGMRYDVFSPGDQIASGDLPSGKRFKRQVSPRLGVAYPISDKDALSFHYGWTYQTPARSYVFENRGAGATVNVRGNPDLEPETNVAYQAGMQHLFSRDVYGQFGVFFRDIYGLVAAREATDPFGNTVAVYENSDYASARGFEASVVKSFSHKFSAELNYTFQLASGVASDPNQALQFIQGNQLYLPISERPLDWDQRHTVSLASTIRDPGRWGIRMLWTYGSGLPFTPTFRDDRKQDPRLVNARRLPSRSDLSLDLDRYFTVWGNAVTLYVDARNVLDARNIANLSPNAASVFNPNVNLTGDDYATYFTETGRAGGAYLQDRNNDGLPDWVPVHDPRVFEEGRAVRLGLAVSF